MQLHDIHVLITGGGSGMGEATALHFASLGAKISILDRDAVAAERVAQEVKGLAFACDVSDAQSVETAIAAANKAQGIARVLVNCAGICPAKRVVGREGPMPLEEFNKVLQVNLVGSFNTLRVMAAAAAQAELIGEERGVIINTASVAAFEGQIGQAAYSASKGGLVAMTLPIARELAGVGIRVMVIAPGLVETPMLAGMPAEVQQSLAAMVPFPKRLAKPKEFAHLAQHIVENAMLNGEVIRLDGAIRMQAK